MTAGDGVVYTYTITVHNGGKSDAQNVSVSDTFPAGFSEGTITPSQGTFTTGTGGNFTAALGKVAAGADATILAREQAEAKTQEQVLPLLGKIGSKLRRELGESLSSIQQFGAPLEADKISPETFTRSEITYQIGVAPIRIDILTQITGVEFSAAWKERVSGTIFAVPVPFISLDHLIANKQATGRSSDLEQLKHISKNAKSGKQD